MNIHRILSIAEPEFAALVRIYTDAHPASERKSTDALRHMINQPEYVFLAAIENGNVVGFSITLCFENSDAALLEYMAVDAAHRGKGIGQYLFRETAAYAPISERFLLIEVDSDHAPSPDRDRRTRRKAFYRRLGCREIDALTYRMPPVTSTRPPLMDMLVHGSELPESIEKKRLRAWLQACYLQVYGVPADDPRIAAMLDALPDPARLI